MDIKVITRHAPANYGSLLQAIATVRTLKEMGHTASVIDYRRKDEEGLQGIFTTLKYKKDWNNNPIKKILYVGMRYPEEKISEFRFAKMRSKYLPMTTCCRDIKDLQLLHADVFMTGSDQVWGVNPNGVYDKAYFLDFVRKGMKVAYAASFGIQGFEENVLQDYKRMLKTYDAISVREDYAVDMLHDMGIKCAGQVLDPTLLLDGKQWSEYIDSEVKGKYVLVYNIHKNARLDEYAQKFANYVGLPLIRVSASFHQVNRTGKLAFCPSLGKFLSYIKNATYMVTDSFHGTAFAINFNKNFIEVLTSNNSTGRNISILRLTGLLDRIVKDDNDFSIANQTIDYSRVNQTMAKERQASLDILKGLLKK